MMHNPSQESLMTVEELIKIASSLSTERDLKRLLEMIVTAARKLTYAEGGSIYILDRTKRHLCIEVLQNDVMKIPLRKLSPVPLFIDGKRNVSHVCAYCAFEGKLVNVPDIYRYSGFDFRDDYQHDQLYNYRTTSVIAIPLRNHEDITIGVLQLANMHDPGTRKPCPFPQQLEGLVTAFASQAAVAINNVQLIQENRRLIEVLERTNRELEQENQALREKIGDQYRFTQLVGSSPAMQQVFSLMKKVAHSDATVLLRGETGTGKELIAATIHHNSRRHAREFVAQNCAAMPEHLLESEFFGYRRGAFTGAASDKQGLLETANDGTMFLDEIGDMPLDMQGKLLRVLQEGEMRPLGGVKSIKVNVRFIAATNRNLQEMVMAGTFREDLYYRLYVFPIDIPPLRERKEDLPVLLHHFIDLFADQYEKKIVGFTPRALDRLLLYGYPGNIRELRNLIERAVLLCEDGGSIELGHLPEQIIAQEDDHLRLPGGIEGQAGLPERVQHFEASLIEEKLRQNDWNQTKTAQDLRVPRRTLIEKMRRYRIKR